MGHVLIAVVLIAVVRMEWESSVLVAMDAERMDMLRWVHGGCAHGCCAHGVVIMAWSGSNILVAMAAGRMDMLRRVGAWGMSS